MIVNFIILLIVMGLLLFGLVQSKKNSFMAGFYAFLLLIIHQIYLFVSPFITNSIIDNYLSNNHQTMTAGELVSIISLIPKTIQIVAFAILIVGLYKMWNKKETQL